ncbi:hypothetical protein D4L84_09100, partial [Campylobacter coli]
PQPWECQVLNTGKINQGIPRISWLIFPVFRTWHSHGWGLCSVPGWGTEILQASQHGHERKKKLKKSSSKVITWCSISETVIGNMQVDKGLAHVHRTPAHQQKKENVTNKDKDLSRHVTKERIDISSFMCFINRQN